MLLTQPYVDLFGYGTVGLACIGVAFGLTCGVYVLYLGWRIGKERLGALRGFNKFWAVRIALVIHATLWAVLEVARLPLVRRHHRPLGSLSYNTQGLLCKCHLLLSSGLAIPCFFLTALFLVRDSIPPAQRLPFSSSPRGRSNIRLLLKTLLYGLPCIVLQLLLVLFVIGEGPSGGDKNRLKARIPAFLTGAYQHEWSENAINSTLSASSTVAVCTYPLLSTAVLMVFAALYSLYFGALCFHKLSLVINKTLQRRLLGLLSVFVILLPLHALFLGLSLIWHPSHILHQVFLCAAFLNVIFCTSIGQGLLVFRPIHDTLDAHVINALQPGVTGFKGIHDMVSEEHGSETPMMTMMVTEAGLSTDYHFSSDDEPLEYHHKAKLDAPLVLPLQPSPAEAAAAAAAAKRHSYTLGILPHLPGLV